VWLRPCCSEDRKVSSEHRSVKHRKCSAEMPPALNEESICRDSRAKLRTTPSLDTVASPWLMKLPTFMIVCSRLRSCLLPHTSSEARWTTVSRLKVWL